MKTRNINEVELVGMIANVFHSRNFLSVTISATRYVAGNGGQTVRNFPHVVWYGEAAQELENKFQKGDRVRITAEVDTSHYSREGDKRRRQTIFTGTSIEMAKGACEERFGVKPTVDRITDVNKVDLAGRVMSTYLPEGKAFAKISLQVIKDNRFNYPEIYFFGKVADFVRTSVKKDDHVCITGSIQTSRVGEGENRRYLENIVCSEIAICDEDE